MVVGIKGNAQITSYADFSESTEYSESDKIFVFCTDDENGASLTANDSTGDGGKVYHWYKYDIDSDIFTKVTTGISYNVDSSSNSIVGLSTGGYKVIVTDGIENQQYLAWVYNTIDRYVELQLTRSTCDGLTLSADPFLEPDAVQGFDTPLEYIDTATGSKYILKNKIDQYNWESDTEPDIGYSNRPYNVMNNELPTEDTKFSVTVTDRFGCVVEDDLDYTAIATKALFSWTAIDEKTFEELSSGDHLGSVSEQAPLAIRFVNESKNGYEYTWWFGDTTRNDDEDTIVTNDFTLEPEHIYFYTDRTESGKTYTMELKSESEAGCTHSISFDITVKPVSIQFPNVFSPTNKDGINDVFYCDSIGDGPVSIRNFKITIFNRAGQVVHEYNGDIRDWKGWDGSVKNSSRMASEGNYYYVVEILGWDKKKYDNDDYSKTNSSSEESGDTSGSVIYIFGTR